MREKKIVSGQTECSDKNILLMGSARFARVCTVGKHCVCSKGRAAVFPAIFFELRRLLSDPERIGRTDILYLFVGVYLPAFQARQSILRCLAL